ncbi:MAG: NAD-dependent epimerase/dehydratase family protein [Streptosporangiaceae bacterium]
MSEILVTGGNGLLGRHLVPELQRRGDTVRVLALPDEDTSWLEQRGVPLLRGDVKEPRTLAAPMAGVSAVVHLAAMIGVWRPMAEYRAVNVAGTQNVCRAALTAGVSRVVHVSSLIVYGMDLGVAAREDTPLRPLREPYSVSKAEGDLAVQQMISEDGLPAVIVRPGTFFGPGDRLNFGRIADRLRTGSAVVIGRGHNAIPWVYVTDLMQGILLALDHPDAVGRIYNIGNDSPLTQLELIEAIADEIGAKPPRRHLPYRAAHSAGWLAEGVARATRGRIPPPVTRHGVMLYGADNRHSIDRARAELGYSPAVPLRDGVSVAAKWYLEDLSAGPGSRPAPPAPADEARV